ncbi:MAG: hypothetical protein V4498_09090 [candidate division FCPU426 bacterium]
MNSSIVIGMGVVLLLFIWSWIGIIILNRIALEKKIEKLAGITNALPEEEETLQHLQELRNIESGKIFGAKFLLAIFMLFLVASLCVAPWWPPLYELFGSQILSTYMLMAFGLLAFFCLPIYVGLGLANPKKSGRRKGRPAPKEEPVKVAAKVAAPQPVAPVVENAADKAEAKADAKAAAAAATKAA